LSDEYFDEIQGIKYKKIAPDKYKIIRVEEIEEIDLAEIDKRIQIHQAEVDRLTALKQKLLQLKTAEELKQV